MRKGAPVSRRSPSMVQRLSAPDQRRRDDVMAIADVAREIVLLDHLAHVVQDLLGRGDRLAGPRLEAIAEGVEIAVGADAGIAMGDPRPAEALLRFQHDEARARALLGQMVGAAHAGDAGADDEHVEMLDGLGGRGRELSGGIGHRLPFLRGVGERPPISRALPAEINLRLGRFRSANRLEDVD